MGEIANDMIDGGSCSWCGTYFEEEHGYPVVCKSCSKDDDYDKATDPPVATKREL